MCYRFTTPLRRRSAHSFAFRQAKTLGMFASSSFSATTRIDGLVSDERGFDRPAHSLAFRQAETLGMFTGSSFSAATRVAKLASPAGGKKQRDWDVSQSRLLWGG